MPYCKNNLKRSYKGTEPSPKGFGWCASGEKVGKKRKGRDGNMWIIKTISSGSKRWVKLNVSDKNVKVKNKLNNKLDCSKFIRYELKSKGLFSVTTKKLEGLKGKQRHIYKFIDFNTFEDKETEVPNGYKPVKTKKDWVKKYKCDSSRKLLQKNNQEYKKINRETKGFLKYFTHDNGGRPFLVYVGKKEVHIYKQNEKDFYTLWSDLSKDDKKNAWMYIKLIKKYKPLEVFIGKSPKNDMTKFSMGYGKKFDGNSILLKISKNRYVFIGSEVYEFSTSDDTIIKYYSPVGNNDVPYPFAYGDKNIYFMLDRKTVSYKNAQALDNMNKTDAYMHYYGHSGYAKLEKYSKKMKSVKIIQKRIW